MTETVKVDETITPEGNLSRHDLELLAKAWRRQWKELDVEASTAGGWDYLSSEEIAFGNFALRRARFFQHLARTARRKQILQEAQADHNFRPSFDLP